MELIRKETEPKIRTAQLRQECEKKKFEVEMETKFAETILDQESKLYQFLLSWCIHNVI